MIYHSQIDTALGYMRACASTAGLCRLEWQQHPFTGDHEENDVSHETVRQLRSYFSGTLRIFTLPLDLSQHSLAFCKWLSIMQTIGYGQTLSYAGFAERWGNRQAARAAGQACQRNPIPVILPCHRIVPACGSVDAYSGGSDKNPRDPENIERKQWLISFERSHSATG